MSRTLLKKVLPIINEYIKNIYDEGELNELSTLRKNRIVQIEGSREISRGIYFYSLEMIIALVTEYDLIEIQFRQWATNRLNEYLVKSLQRMKQLYHKKSYHFNGSSTVYKLYFQIILLECGI